MNENSLHDFNKHPCFNPEAKGNFGRVHLPVAPKCNIRCNFCDRRYDCVNESRPGVTSGILTPEQANVYMSRVLEKEGRITVAGIAGPGDPFANPVETMQTLRNIRKHHPEILLCVSSNGLEMYPFIEELAQLKVSHVTITVCGIDPEITAQIYNWVQDGKIVYRGRSGAELLLRRQLRAIKELKKHGIVVKINCIVIPGINDHHVTEVARKMKELGADLFNCMAMFPNLNTPFGSITQPDKKMMTNLRREAEKHLPQMKHCTRCRADAVGLLGEDRSDEFRSCLKAHTELKSFPQNKRHRVAVGTEEGVLINKHLGEALRFSIWEKDSSAFRFVEDRPAPAAGGGIARWHQLSRVLGDCRAVLVSGVGRTPKEILMNSGIKVFEASGFIEDALRVVYENKDPGVLRGRRSSCADGSCTGTGAGCG